MISHPKFIQTHLGHLHLQAPKLLLQTDGPPISIDSENPNPYWKVLHCPCENPSAYFQPLCSSDGLILVHVHGIGINLDGTRSGNESFILWNPSNRSHRRISCPYELPLTSLYGLCYDSTADDYRVFIVSYEKVTLVAVYGLRNNSWDIFVDNRYRLYVSEHQAAVVNGAVHWVMFSDESSLWVILYFDLVEGKFKEVPPPSSWKEGDEMNLVVLGGFLCVYCDVGKRQIEVYAMKEYGKKESWVRLFVIPSASERRFPWLPSSNHVKPLCLTKNGQVLISMGTCGLGIYYPKDCMFSPYGSIWDWCWTPIPYVESLVALHEGV